MGKRLAENVYVHRTVDNRYETVLLTKGTVVPDWAVPLITNSKLLGEEVAEVEEAPVTPTDDATAPENTLEEHTKEELVALAKERGVTSRGTKADLIAALTEEPETVDEVDFHSLSGDALRAYAKARGLEVEPEWSDAEITDALE